MAYPRVLFVAPHAFNRITGGGITFSNLFRGWPQEALATVHNDPEPTTDDVCNRYYVLGERELDLAPPFNRLRRGYRATVGGAKDGSAAGVAAAPGLVSRVKALTLRLLGDSFPERACLTRELEAWIAAFRPQVIYTILGSNGMMELIEGIRLRFDLPVVVHIMDDWMTSYHRRGLLGPWQRRKMDRWVTHFMGVADTCLGISPAMCEAFATRYGREFQSFQNTIDVARWSRYGRPGCPSKVPADVLYVGSIFPNAQLESLVDCCHAVALLNEAGLATTLTIVSPDNQVGRYASRLLVHPAIRIEPSIGDDDRFFRRIADADVLLLPVNFDTASVGFIRYSMPTKVPAYLTVGTPILAYGPASTAQIDYALKSGWAEVIVERDEGRLTGALRSLIGDVALRGRLSATAMKVAELNHDSQAVRSKFQDTLRRGATRISQQGAKEQ